MPNELREIAARLSQLPRETVEAAIERFDVLAKESASRVVGGGAVMNMHTRRGRTAVPLGTEAKIYDRGNSVTVFVRGKPKFAWVWIESGTAAHQIGRRYQGKAVFLKGPRYDHPIAGPIMHHGSRGQRAWTRAVNEFAGEFTDIAVKNLAEAVK